MRFCNLYIDKRSRTHDQMVQAARSGVQNITLELVEAVAGLKDELEAESMQVVFRDSSFPDDVVKTNAVQTLRRNGIDDVRSL